MSAETVTISKDEYEGLKLQALKLQCLECGGVDNWEWYHESLKEGGYLKAVYGEDEED